MLRKMLTIAGMALVLASAACNTMTGPESNGLTQKRPGGGQRQPAELDKVCIDDLRAVQITSPAASERLYSGDQMLVTWETLEICGRYSASVKVSFDGGATWSLVSEAKDALSAAWKLPMLDNVPVMLEVSVSDRIGTVSQRLEFQNYMARTRPGVSRPPVEHD